MPDYRYWHEKDPYVCNQIRDIGEVGKVHEVQAFALDFGIPKCFDRLTGQCQSHCYSNSPCYDESARGGDNLTEKRQDKHTVVEGENGELYKHQSEAKG